LVEGRDSFNSGGKVRGREGTGNDHRKINEVTIIKIYLNIFNKKKKKRKKRTEQRNSPTWYRMKEHINSRYWEELPLQRVGRTTPRGRS